jgi:hypothetical protein
VPVPVLPGAVPGAVVVPLVPRLLGDVPGEVVPIVPLVEGGNVEPAPVDPVAPGVPKVEPLPEVVPGVFNELPGGFSEPLGVVVVPLLPVPRLVLLPAPVVEELEPRLEPFVVPRPPAPPDVPTPPALEPTPPPVPPMPPLLAPPAAPPPPPAPPPAPPACAKAAGAESASTAAADAAHSHCRVVVLRVMRISLQP